MSLKDVAFFHYFLKVSKSKRSNLMTNFKVISNSNSRIQMNYKQFCDHNYFHIMLPIKSFWIK